MNDKNRDFLEDSIFIRKFKHRDSGDLIEAGFPFGYNVLKRFSRDIFFQKINFVPFETRLVACHVHEKRVIGYLSLVAHSRFLYSIRYVFSNPSFRQMGVATRLVKYALDLAKKKGGKKLFLTADPDPLDASSRLYHKLGFRIISSNPVLKGNGNTLGFQSEKEKPSIPLHLYSKTNKDTIFNIYRNSLGEDLMNFFEINSDNFINGISQDFKHFFFKNAFINDSAESLALVFNYPFMHTATAEIYSQSPLLLGDMIIALNKILYDRGIRYLTISLFNAKDVTIFDLLKDRQFYPYQAVYMGRSL